jgi:hypothetical protein
MRIVFLLGFLLASPGTPDGKAVVSRRSCGGKAQTMRVSLAGGDPAPTAEILGGSSR